jgi:cytochrome c553
MKIFVKWTAIVLGGVISLTFLTGLALYPIGMKKFTRTYPNIAVEAVNIPTAADAIARGRHISIVWGCTKCHGENLSGTLMADDPILGTIPASNLTYGNGGIARSYTDVDWVRAIRHGVKPDSKVEIFMYDYYSTLSDQDLGDLIAYLKQIQPVDSEYPAIHIGPLIAIAPAVGLFKPAAELIDHDTIRATKPVAGATIEYGRYLSAICTECHGGGIANAVKNWKQEDFIRTFNTGVLPDGKKLSPTMSSKTFSEMNDTELAALWLYFTSTKP